ncbi:hypothetical protein JVX98_28300 [Ensifer sp. PDNC004]|uniref:hypothetical protein n=1 Tax=Ensifer sp. PDNC004 TaxID=2811423 RepID=UPI00196445A9|nr:hypothetical protein [Ensifer sp. PDNC004]QRY68191.1 hypothetical protein JVX98_28300 [Ensifer sp. PDNC004]
MSNALKVLAECLDKRTGRRFLPGETFDPPPTVEQAKRLISGGCLSEAALKLALNPEASAKAVTAALKVDTSTAAADIDRLLKEVVDARQKAEVEIVLITKSVEDARAVASGQIEEIGKGLAAAKNSADADLAKITADVASAREKAADDIRAIETEVEKAREEAAKRGAGKQV